MQEIPTNILKLLTPKGFIEYYYKICLEYNTNIEAYEATEKLYYKWFGKNRYSNYESFRIVKNRNLKKTKK